jgi:hypothetical protein
MQMQIDNMQMTDPMMACLTEFSQSVNAHTRLKTLLKGWEPVIVVNTKDTGCFHHFRVRGSQIVALSEGEPADTGHTVLLRANQSEMAAIFTGRLNPAAAYLKGQLEVYGSTLDQVKLDAICLVLWGL